MPKKIIQVPLDRDLLEALNEVSRAQAKSRSALIREACARYVAKIKEEERERQYIEGYTKFPEGEEEEAWARMGEQELARRLAEDEW